jgi:hypothetical protein
VTFTFYRALIFSYNFEGLCLLKIPVLNVFTEGISINWMYCQCHSKVSFENVVPRLKDKIYEPSQASIIVKIRRTYATFSQFSTFSASEISITWNLNSVQIDILLCMNFNLNKRL